jgi:hypothetical protein
LNSTNQPETISTVKLNSKILTGRETECVQLHNFHTYDTTSHTLKIPAKLCPRFIHCSVNNCPLHPDYTNLSTSKLDREQKCTMEKNVRKRIASQFLNLLKLGGLTPQEYSAKRRFDAFSVAVKIKIANRGREALRKLHNSHKPKIDVS